MAHITKRMYWILISLSIFWAIGWVVWGGKHSGEIQPMWPVYMLGGLVVLWGWAELIYPNTRGVDVMDFTNIKIWIPVFVLSILVMTWASWLFRYTPHPATARNVIVTLDRWTGCVNVHIADRRILRIEKSCPEKNKD